MSGDARPVVVVGVDGSQTSKDALRWAVRQAEVIVGGVHAVMAWRLPATYGYVPDYSGVDFAADARKTLDSAVAEVTRDVSSVPVLTAVAEGHPAATLGQGIEGRSFAGGG